MERYFGENTPKLGYIAVMGLSVFVGHYLSEGLKKNVRCEYG